MQRTSSIIAKMRILNNVKKFFNPKRFFLLIALTTAGVIIFFVTKKETPKNSLPTSTPTLQKIKIQSGYGQSNAFVIFDSNASFNLPKYLKIYKIENLPFTKEEAYLFAEKLETDQNFFEVNDAIFGKIFLFSGENSSLRITPYQHILDYKKFNITDENLKFVPKTEEIAKIALSFLLEKQLIPNKEYITFSNIKALSIRQQLEENSTSQPNAISISFLTKIESYPLYGSSYNTGVINVILNNELKVFRVYADLPEKIISSDTYPAKDLEYLKKNASTEAIIQSLDNGRIDVSDLSGGLVKQIEINEIETGYLQETAADAKYLQPVFHLKGTATLLTGVKVNTALYMPAIINKP